MNLNVSSRWYIVSCWLCFFWLCQLSVWISSFSKIIAVILATITAMSHRTMFRNLTMRRINPNNAQRFPPLSPIIHDVESISKKQHWTGFSASKFYICNECNTICLIWQVLLICYTLCFFTSFFLLVVLLPFFSLRQWLVLLLIRFQLNCAQKKTI